MHGYKVGEAGQRTPNLVIRIRKSEDPGANTTKAAGGALELIANESSLHHLVETQPQKHMVVHKIKSNAADRIFYHVKGRPTNRLLRRMDRLRKKTA